MFAYNFQMMKIFLPVILFVFALVSCQKEPDLVPTPDPDPVPDSTIKKLLPKIMGNDVQYDSLVYDDQNRMIEQWSVYEGSFRKEVFTYTADKIVSLEEYAVFPGPLTKKRVFSESINSVVIETLTYYNDGRESTSQRALTVNDKGKMIATYRESDGRKQKELVWSEKGRLESSGNFDSDNWVSLSFKYDDKQGVYSAVNAIFPYDDIENHLARCFDVNNLLEAKMSHINREGVEERPFIYYTFDYNDDGYPVKVKRKDGDRESEFTIKYVEAK